MTTPPAAHSLDRARGDSGLDSNSDSFSGSAPQTAPPTVRTKWRVDISDSVPLAGLFEIAVDVIAPARLPEDAPAVMLACLPGGFLSRRYYDLDGPGDSRPYSFAEAMARQGFITLAFDPIAVGESSRPEPIEGGYALGAEELAGANQRALEMALARLAEGDAIAGIPAGCTPNASGSGIQWDPR